MSKLYNYLISLDCADSQQGIWANPENPTEDFRIGQYCFENGGLADGWECIGSLDRLSFGAQSEYEAFANWATTGGSESINSNIQTIKFNGKKVAINPQGIWEAYNEGDLDSQFEKAITDHINAYRENAAEWEVTEFIENLESQFA